MDAEIQQMTTYIDTLGNQDQEIRKQINLDSLKLLLKSDLTNMLNEQEQSKENTLLEFRNNGMALMTSIEGTDSAMYSLEGNLIKIDEGKLKGFGETMTFEIISLKPDTLYVKFIDYGDTSFVLMVPTK